MLALVLPVHTSAMLVCSFLGQNVHRLGGLKLLAFRGVDPAAAEKFQRIQCRVVVEGGHNW